MTDRAPDKLTGDLVAALGGLVVQHAAVEEALRDAITIQDKSDKIAVGILLAGMQFSVLLDKFGAIYYERVPTRRAEVQALCKHLRHLNERRNRFIHSFWTEQEGAAATVSYRVSASPKHGLVLRATGVPASDVESLTTELHIAGEKLWELTIEMNFPAT